MAQFNEFAFMEELNKGMLQFILCPHLQAMGRGDTNSRFIHLIDNQTDCTMILALCGVCLNVVKGALMKDIVGELTKEFQEKALKQLNDHLFWTR